MGKRKAASKKAEGSRKKTKIVHKNPDDLPWKTVKRPVVAGLDGDLLELPPALAPVEQLAERRAVSRPAWNG